MDAVWHKEMTVSRITTGHGSTGPGLTLDFDNWDGPPAFEVGDIVTVTVTRKKADQDTSPV